MEPRRESAQVSPETEFVIRAKERVLKTLIAVQESASAKVPPEIRTQIIKLVQELMQNKKTPTIVSITMKVNDFISELQKRANNNPQSLLDVKLEALCKQLEKDIFKNNVARFHQRYLMAEGPDPKYKGKPLEPKEFLNNEIPNHMINAMLADPEFCIVYVSGASFSKYGHALIFLGDAGFLHIDGLNSPPQHLTIQEFNDYLSQHGKCVLGIQTVDLPNLNDAIVGVCELIKEKYTWGVIKHNCLDFCHEVMRRGGHDLSIRDEYNKFNLSLSTNYLDVTPQHQLRPDQRNLASLRPDFEPKLFEEMKIIDFTNYAIKILFPMILLNLLNTC